MSIITLNKLALPASSILQVITATDETLRSTTSTSFVMMLCDCLANTIMEKRKFTNDITYFFSPSPYGLAKGL